MQVFTQNATVCHAPDSYNNTNPAAQRVVTRDFGSMTAPAKLGASAYLR